MSNPKVWFVTGASKGLGLNLVKQLLEQGSNVAATSRSIDDLRKAVGADNPRFLPLAVDLKTDASVKEAIQTTVDRFGHIDVVVNNAGYGLAGSIEELTDEEIRQNFDINVFGSFNVIRQVMPHLRKQHSGHIFNISSIGGFSGMAPGFASYSSTKFAVQGFSESLAADVKDFGVKVTIVSPGYFRTNFLTSGSLGVPKHPIKEYESVRQSQDSHQQEMNGNQPGDPDKLATALISVADEPNPPLHLFLGTDAYEMANTKIKAVQDDLKRWKELTFSTDLEEKEEPSHA